MACNFFLNHREDPPLGRKFEVLQNLGRSQRECSKSISIRKKILGNLKRSLENVDLDTKFCNFSINVEVLFEIIQALIKLQSFSMKIASQSLR